MRILPGNSILILFPVLFFLQGCTDHVTPRLTRLTTLHFQIQDGRFIFTVQGDELGDSPVKEFGIVYTAYFRGVGNHNVNPTIDDNRIRFNLPLTEGLNKFDYSHNFIKGRTYFYYRAYAISDNNTIVYGNPLTFTLP